MRQTLLKIEIAEITKAGIKIKETQGKFLNIFFIYNS